MIPSLIGHEMLKLVIKGSDSKNGQTHINLWISPVKFEDFGCQSPRMILQFFLQENLNVD